MGTKGPPKGVMLTHTNLVSNICQAAHPALDFIQDEDTTVCLLPMFHIFALANTMAQCLWHGAKMVTFAPGWLARKPNRGRTRGRMVGRWCRKGARQSSGWKEGKDLRLYALPSLIHSSCMSAPFYVAVVLWSIQTILKLLFFFFLVLKSEMLVMVPQTL